MERRAQIGHVDCDCYCQMCLARTPHTGLLIDEAFNLAHYHTFVYTIARPIGTRDHCRVKLATPWHLDLLLLKYNFAAVLGAYFTLLDASSSFITITSLKNW